MKDTTKAGLAAVGLVALIIALKALRSKSGGATLVEEAYPVDILKERIREVEYK